MGTYAPSRYVESARVQLPGGGAPTIAGVVSRLEGLAQLPGAGAHVAPELQGSVDWGEAPRLATEDRKSVV